MNRRHYHINIEQPGFLFEDENHYPFLTKREALEACTAERDAWLEVYPDGKSFGSAEDGYRFYKDGDAGGIATGRSLPTLIYVTSCAIAECLEERDDD